MMRLRTPQECVSFVISDLSLYQSCVTIGLSRHTMHTVIKVGMDDIDILACDYCEAKHCDYHDYCVYVESVYKCVYTLQKLSSAIIMILHDNCKNCTISIIGKRIS